jgi:serine/threonine-protein kinase Chk1
MSFWCLPHVHRQSQLASQGPVVLADKLTQSLRDTGDLDLVEIDMQSYVGMSARVE